MAVALFSASNAAQADPPDSPILIAPTDLATNVSTSPNLQVTVNDPDADPVSATFYGRKINGPGEDFTIIAMPDTQHYTDGIGDAATFSAQTQWIVANREARNIVFVTGLGDIVQDGSAVGNDAQWVIADTAYSFLEDPLTSLLEDGIPFGLSVGNHDQTPIGGGDTASTLKYNEYFGESRFAGRSYYGGHYAPAGDLANNDNHFQLFSAGGMDFIIIHFEFDTSPLQAVLDWADALLSTHADRRAIVSTHYLINTGNPAAWGTQGQAIYNALEDHENLFLMVAGHQHGEGRRQDTASNGNTVNTLLSDYQDYPNGGDGWLRIMTFSPANDTISVQTYSPTLDQFEVDDSSQFTLDYPMDGLADFRLIGTVSDIPSGNTAAANWPGLDWETGYEWYVTSDDGNEPATTGPIWSFTTAPQPPATIPPDTQIDSGPANASNSADASFEFSGSDNLTPPASLLFECALDASGFSACTSPQQYSGLAEGLHQFAVRAIDGDANTDPSAAIFDWVIDFSPTVVLQSRIATSSDDAEESLTNGSLDLASTDLEMVLDTGASPDKNQLVGLRFSTLDIPPGASVLSAYLEFETDETSSVATSLLIRGQAADSASTFSSTVNNLSSRPLGNQSTAWSPPAWSQTSARHRSPELRDIVQEILDRENWTAGNAMAFVISGSGQRVAESFDGEPLNAPLLRIEYANLQLNQLSLQQGVDGYSGNIDTYLASNAAGTNYSLSTNLIVDLNPENHILMRFEDLVGEQDGQIPPGSTIWFAQLDIHVSNESTQGARLHRMLQDWSDSDTWNTWADGISSDDVEARSEYNNASTGSAVGFASIEVTKDIQAWVDGETNRGWAWLPPNGDNSWQFNSAEGVIPPRLSIFYLPPELVFGDGFE